MELSNEEIGELWGDYHTGNTSIIRERVKRIYEEGYERGSADATRRLKLINELAADFLEKRNGK